MDSFLGEIRPFPFNWAPYGWMLCQGQTLPIQSYAALFSIIGTTYGGNGTTNFQLPNLQGLALVGYNMPPGGGSNIAWGEVTGSSAVTLLQTNLPGHTHTFNGKTLGGASRTPAPDTTSFISNYLFKPASGSNQGLSGYTQAAPDTQLSPLAITATGSSLPHENRSPFLVINYCISINGQFPTRN